MPPRLRPCNGSSLGSEMATIQVISVLILVLGFDVFHSLSSPGDLERSSRKIFKRLNSLTADACQIYSSLRFNPNRPAVRSSHDLLDVLWLRNKPCKGKDICGHNSAENDRKRNDMPTSVT